MKKAKNINIKNPALIILILSLLHVGCNFDTSGQYTYHLPEKLNDGLDVGTLNEVNIDHKYIEAAVNNILADKFNEVHSILIFRNNELVVEEYFWGHKWQWDAPYHHGENVTWNRTMSHNIMSVTKSVTSACIGIAIDRGFIESVHQTIFDYLPEHKHLIANGKDKITIEHLLTMTSGLEWREWSAPYSSAENPTIGIWFQDKDPITFILEMPLIDEPGTDFNYSTGNMIILGEIIRNATNMTIDEFSSNYLFEPLGIDSSHWAIKCENGVDQPDDYSEGND
jgi:hypothetical protein